MEGQEMRQYGKMTEEKFNAIKLLLKAGATQAECAKYMGVSDTTVGIVKKSEDYEEYKHNSYLNSSAYRKKIAAIKAKENEKKPEEQVAVKEPEKQETVTKVVHEQSVTIQATHYMMQEIQKTNELLKGISAKLAFIVDELTGVKHS